VPIIDSLDDTFFKKLKTMFYPLSKNFFGKLVSIRFAKGKYFAFSTFDHRLFGLDWSKQNNNNNNLAFCPKQVGVG
jgi:hypothetical protein